MVFTVGDKLSTNDMNVWIETDNHPCFAVEGEVQDSRLVKEPYSAIEGSKRKSFLLGIGNEHIYKIFLNLFLTDNLVGCVADISTQVMNLYLTGMCVRQYATEPISDLLMNRFSEAFGLVP